MKPPSLPLATPDGEVLSYACGLCRRVHACATFGVADQRERAIIAERGKNEADRCCVCDLCGKVEVGARSYCLACSSAALTGDDDGPPPCPGCGGRGPFGYPPGYMRCEVCRGNAWGLPPRPIAEPDFATAGEGPACDEGAADVGCES